MVKLATKGDTVGLEIRFCARAHTRRTRRVYVRAMLREDPNFLRAVCAVYAVYAVYAVRGLPMRRRCACVAHEGYVY